MKIGVIGRLTDHIQVAWIYFFVIYWLSFPLVTRYLLCFNFFTILSILFYPICHQVWSLLFFSIHSDFTQYSQAVEARIPVVSSEWVHMSVKCESLLPTPPFSPAGDGLFSKLIVCPSQIPPADRDPLLAMIVYHNGKYQTNLNSSCTHLVIGKPTGRKYVC